MADPFLWKIPNVTMLENMAIVSDLITLPRYDFLITNSVPCLSIIGCLQHCSTALH